MKFNLPRLPRISLDRMFAIIATVVSVCTLSLSFYQAHLNRKQQYASVWPYLMVSTTNVSLDDGTPQFYIEVYNKGVGPAMIEDFDLIYQSRHFHDEYDYFRTAMIQKGITDTTGFVQRSNLWKGRVISPGESIKWLNARGIYAHPLERAFGEAQIRIRFKSIYDEYWEFRGPSQEPVVKLPD
jgi:hypothetical protein